MGLQPAAASLALALALEPVLGSSRLLLAVHPTHPDWALVLEPALLVELVSEPARPEPKDLLPPVVVPALQGLVHWLLDRYPSLLLDSSRHFHLLALGPKPVLPFVGLAH